MTLQMERIRIWVDSFHEAFVLKHLVILWLAYMSPPILNTFGRI